VFEASAKAGAERATRRGKALRAGEAAPFDEGAGEAVLAAARGFGCAASRQGASEIRSSSSRAVENTAATGRRLRGLLDRETHQEQPAPAPSSDDAGSVVERVEAGSATSTARPLGPFGGALAPTDVMEGVRASAVTPRVGPFEQVLVS
jgi:hypothetical protein